jgi:hypothetical protein
MSIPLASDIFFLVTFFTALPFTVEVCLEY